MNDGLIYDWNPKGDQPEPAGLLLNDETLRDGLQSPSVKAPTIDQKLASCTCSIASASIPPTSGCPAPVHTSSRTSSASPREIRRMPTEGAGELRRADPGRRHPADRRHRPAHGLPIECCCFIGSSPIRRYAEDWTVDYLQRCTEEAVGFAVRQGLTVMYVTEDTTRSDPDTLRRLFSTAIRAGASRLCIADTVGHATPDGARAIVRFVKSIVEEHGGGVGIDWHGHRDRDMGTINSIAAHRGRCHARARHDARSRRAGRQHADGSADGQPGADGLDRPRPDAPERPGADVSRRPPASRFPTTIRCSAAMRSARPPASTPPRWSRPSTKRTPNSPTRCIQACRRGSSGGRSRSRSVRCPANRTSSSGSSTAASRRRRDGRAHLPAGQGVDDRADRAGDSPGDRSRARLRDDAARRVSRLRLDELRRPGPRNLVRPRRLRHLGPVSHLLEADRVRPRRSDHRPPHRLVVSAAGAGAPAADCADASG